MQVYCSAQEAIRLAVCLPNLWLWTASVLHLVVLEPLQGRHQGQQLQVSTPSTWVLALLFDTQAVLSNVNACWRSEARLQVWLRHSQKPLATAGNAATQFMRGRLSMAITVCCFHKLVLVQSFSCALPAACVFSLLPPLPLPNPSPTNVAAGVGRSHVCIEYAASARQMQIIIPWHCGCQECVCLQVVVVLHLGLPAAHSVWMDCHCPARSGQLVCWRLHHDRSVQGS